MSDDILEKLVLLLFGWLLGLLAPVIVDAIKKRRENSLGRTAIISELNELASTLGLAAYATKLDLGTVDKPFIEWLKNDLEKHGKSSDLQRHIDTLRKQLAWSDEEFKKVVAHYAAKDGKGTVLQHYPIPLLDARVSALWSFDTSLQRQLLQVRQSVSLLDDLVERSRKYQDLTFSKLEGDNHRLVVENAKQACTEYANRAIKTVEKIRAISI